MCSGVGSLGGRLRSNVVSVVVDCVVQPKYSLAICFGFMTTAANEGTVRRGEVQQWVSVDQPGGSCSVETFNLSAGLNDVP